MKRFEILWKLSKLFPGEIDIGKVLEAADIKKSVIKKLLEEVNAQE